MTRRLDDATRRARANAEITRATDARRRMDQREDRRQAVSLAAYARETEQYRQQALTGDAAALRHYVNRSFSEAEAAQGLGLSESELQQRYRDAARRRGEKETGNGYNHPAGD